MLSPRRLLEIARKWRKMAALGRKRISWPRRDASRESNTKNTSIANRGHFVVYTSEGRRFTVPLAFLSARMFQELLRLSEEEFGFSGDGPISLPCDAVFLEYVLSLLKKRGPKDAEREMLIFGFMRRCSRSSLDKLLCFTNQQAMLSPRRLHEIASRWQKMAALRRKRISWMRRDASPEFNTKSTSIAEKGYFVVYSSEGRRFVIPLAFLGTKMFQELLRFSEEEFGFSGDGPISLPCDAVFLEYVLSMLKRRGSKDAERETLISGFMSHCLRISLYNVGHSQQLVVF
ncbi:unnamed protein product [Musa hybrid cultivar]